MPSFKYESDIVVPPIKFNIVQNKKTSYRQEAGRQGVKKENLLRPPLCSPCQEKESQDGIRMTVTVQKTEDSVTTTDVSDIIVPKYSDCSKKKQHWKKIFVREMLNVKTKKKRVEVSTQNWSTTKTKHVKVDAATMTSNLPSPSCKSENSPFRELCLYPNTQFSSTKPEEKEKGDWVSKAVQEWLDCGLPLEPAEAQPTCGACPNYTENIGCDYIPDDLFVFEEFCNLNPVQNDSEVIIDFNNL